MAIKAESIIISKSHFDQAKHNEKRLETLELGVSRLEDFLKELLRTDEEMFTEAVEEFNENYDDVSLKLEGEEITLNITG